MERAVSGATARRWSVASSLGLSSTLTAGNHGYKSSKDLLPREAPPGQVTADKLVKTKDLPQDFDWRDVNGVNSVTSDVNQHIPQYCGSCWIHGTTASSNDRIKVMRRGKFPDVMSARQVLMNCVPSPNKSSAPPGCDGGDPWMIHKYSMDNDVPDETCMPYQARNMECNKMDQCRNCLSGHGCWSIDTWTGYGVSSYGNLSGEIPMMKEIYARGPITCSFATDNEFMMNMSKVLLENEGVYSTTKKYTADQVDHNMEVTGWGVTASGTKYWVIRNSWGTYFGSNGWFKLKRGENQLSSEADCDWSIPRFHGLDEVSAGRVSGSYMTGMTTKVSSKTSEAILKAPESIAPSMAVADSDRSWSLMTAAMAASAAVAVVTVTMRAGRSDKREPSLG